MPTVLERAAQLVEEGWCQNAPARSWDGQDRDAHVSQDELLVAWSVAGALEQAASERLPHDQCAALDAVEAALYALVPVVVERDAVPPRAGPDAFDRLLALVCDWNDAPGRTGREVGAALRGAAERARRRQAMTLLCREAPGAWRPLRGGREGPPKLGDPLGRDA